MKFSLLTLGALAISAQQASALRGNDGRSSQVIEQQAEVAKNVCSTTPLSFDIAEAGQSVTFKCDKTLKVLDPALDSTSPKMYKGSSPVTIHDFLPSATLTEVTAAADDKVSETRQGPAETGSEKEKEYKFTVPTLPSEQQDLHVYCKAEEPSKVERTENPNACQVTFHIASSAVRPFLAAGVVAGVIASVLQFA
ncbi:SAG-related sequence SRS22A [Toxoplasma gondii GAB2-2007-GAL-DOM2]|uniref:SAG-related sequence SRS22A n=6 Tax=Toxoplasma gondii TaxID=5811 RepID=S7URT8_TOXGG|nr:SAG-related sequence SRS22A [Toxoplasma gondii GT1]KAF4643544.1 SAG-related sequence SRS22A [Toxoplasma gondii]KFG29756.1 SAG-related sequence SRS22A [Toxoplasma gondii GAB2-2007-GAL-DOM2]KFG33995.1 SAG-related sequence SRS22A [Toxoplasma gondii FOU]KFH02839.1 SAG-related sequence SRS22A [Toxoplasma gondii MAS]RQX70675.1 SAG-related sequence SRS22A [Toxoplasma gondii CAST]